jgi:hypothetical protein
MGYVKIPGATNRVSEFTSSGTWVCPSGVYSAEFLVVGAGGGGGGTSVSTALNYASGGGGGGGAVKKVNLITTPGTSYTITIGAKGTGASAAVGGNGGFTEVLNGATTLVRSFGGQGGGACIADVQTLPTISRTAAGAGGNGTAGNNTSTKYGAGGGGAAYGSNATGTVESGTINKFYSSEGTPAGNGSTTLSNYFMGFGSGGIDGYGAGGSGGATAIGATNAVAGASYFAGLGNYLTATGAGNGIAAVANTGCGGGGGSSFLSTTSTSGGNGADGLVRIVYFA